MSISPVDVLNLVGRGEVVQDKLLSQLMYLMWYEHMCRKHGRARGFIHESLANKYYEEFGKKIATWEIPNRDIRDIL